MRVILDQCQQLVWRACTIHRLYCFVELESLMTKAGKNLKFDVQLVLCWPDVQILGAKLAGRRALSSTKEALTVAEILQWLSQVRLRPP